MLMELGKEEGSGNRDRVQQAARRWNGLSQQGATRIRHCRRLGKSRSRWNRSTRSGRALEPSDRILGSSTLTQEPSEKSGTRNRTITRSMSRVWDTAWARMTQYTAITVRYKRAELHTCCKVLPGRTEPTRNPEPRRDWEHFRTNCSRDKPRERRREYSRAWADEAILTKLSVESGSGGHDVWIQVRFTHCRYVA